VLVVALAWIALDDPFKYFGFMATTATFAILGTYILIALAGMVFFWRTRSADTAFQIVFDVALPLEALFVTARTVEGHLTNVFRKLDLESREGIAEAMAATPPGG
jgi:amino acid transporter